jgi:hypothetical protein
MVTFNQVEQVKYFKKHDKPLEINNTDTLYIHKLFSLVACPKTSRDHVYLHSISNQKNHQITGLVHVSNLDYHKETCIKYTLDSWKSFHVIHARYHSSLNSKIDVFLFDLPIPMNTLSSTESFNSFSSGALEFCIFFQVVNQVYWDNNRGYNYKLHVSRTAGQTKNRIEKSVNTIQPINIGNYIPLSIITNYAKSYSQYSWIHGLESPLSTSPCF